MGQCVQNCMTHVLCYYGKPNNEIGVLPKSQTFAYTVQCVQN